MARARARWWHAYLVDLRLIRLINELLAIVQAHPQDLNWQTYYDGQQELLRDLRDHSERVRCGDGSRLPEQVKLFIVPRDWEAKIALQIVEVPPWPVASDVSCDSMWNGRASGCQRWASPSMFMKHDLPV